MILPALDDLIQQLFAINSRYVHERREKDENRFFSSFRAATSNPLRQDASEHLSVLAMFFRDYYPYEQEALSNTSSYSPETQDQKPKRKKLKAIYQRESHPRFEKVLGAAIIMELHAIYDKNDKNDSVLGKNLKEIIQIKKMIEIPLADELSYLREYEAFIKCYEHELFSRGYKIRTLDKATKISELSLKISDAIHKVTTKMDVEQKKKMKAASTAAKSEVTAKKIDMPIEEDEPEEEEKLNCMNSMAL